MVSSVSEHVLARRTKIYTNPHNIICTLEELLNRNSQQINKTVRVYQSKRSLTVIEGMRNTLPAGAYPALEIEPNDAANEWATTRAQRPRFTFTCTLTVLNENLKLSVEYISTITTVLTEIMTSPENLQLRVFLFLFHR